MQLGRLFASSPSIRLGALLIVDDADVGEGAPHLRDSSYSGFFTSSTPARGFALRNSPDGPPVGEKARNPRLRPVSNAVWCWSCRVTVFLFHCPFELFPAASIAGISYWKRRPADDVDVLK